MQSWYFLNTTVIVQYTMMVHYEASSQGGMGKPK